MEVTWDPRKAAANQRKHKVSFEEASTVIADPLAITGADPDHSAHEDRWITFGLSNRHRLLAVSHTDEGDTIRIITAQNVGSMKKARSRTKDELRRSYRRSDFPGGFTRGKYTARLALGSNVVVLSRENAAAFPTSEAVNEALNGLVRVAKSARLTRRSSGRRSR